MSVQNMNKKKTTIGAVVAVGAAAIALGAGTFAFFSSTGTPTGTNATAGTLQINQSVSGDFDLSGLVPSDTDVRTNTLKLTNGGTVIGNIDLTTAVADFEDGCKGDEPVHDSNCGTAGAAGDLSGLLKVTVTRTIGGSANVLYDNLPVSGLSNADLDTKDVAPGQTVIYTFEYQLPNKGATDNAVQGDSAKVTTTATLKQPY